MECSVCGGWNVLFVVDGMCCVCWMECAVCAG
jgi:hypothetical protein